MQPDFQTEKDEIKRLLLEIGKVSMYITDVSIAHSTTIKLHIAGTRNLFLECNYCSYFRGETRKWINTELILEERKKKIDPLRPQREETTLILTNKANNYFLECKYIQIIDTHKENDLNSRSVCTVSERILSSDLLEKWHRGRAHFVNSDFYKLTLRIDLNIHERFVNFSNQEKDGWYTLNTNDYLDIHCVAPTFLSINFNTWELTSKMVLTAVNDSLVLKDESDSFEIHAQYFCVEEFGKNEDDYLKLGRSKFH